MWYHRNENDSDGIHTKGVILNDTNDYLFPGFSVILTLNISSPIISIFPAKSTGLLIFRRTEQSVLYIPLMMLVKL